jgi:hypothetical protein
MLAVKRAGVIFELLPTLPLRTVLNIISSYSLMFYPLALIALIVFVVRIPLQLVSSPPRTFVRLRSFGLNKALKKISPAVSENLAGWSLAA